MPEEIVEAILTEFFTGSIEGWMHERADREIATFSERVQAASKAGKASAASRTRPTATPVEPPLNARSTPVEIRLNGNPTPVNQPVTINQEPIYSPLPPKGGEEEKNQGGGVSPRIEKTGEKTAVRGGDIAELQKKVLPVSSTQETASGNRIDQRFSEFWQAYPENRRKNLYRAQSAFSASVHAMPTQDDLIRSLEAFKQSKEWRQDNGKFIPSPETWIAEHRWQDAPAFSPTAKPKPKSDIDEADAFRWRAETYPESLEVHPSASTFPTAKWPADIRREYLTARKTNQPQPQAT